MFRFIISTLLYYSDSENYKGGNISIKSKTQQNRKIIKLPKIEDEFIFKL